MTTVKVGIQGSIGSSNHRACQAFHQQGYFSEYEMLPLLSSDAVLQAVENGEIDLGIFAWKSSRKGVVEESKKAVEKYTFQKIGELSLNIDHALLIRSEDQIDSSKLVRVYSHPQAIAEHGDYLAQCFECFEVNSEADTALCAKYLSEGKYPLNSLVIAPIICAEIYGLAIFEERLPSNEGYVTDFFLVKAQAVLED